MAAGRIQQHGDDDSTASSQAPAPALAPVSVCSRPPPIKGISIELLVVRIATITLDVLLPEEDEIDSPLSLNPDSIATCSNLLPDSMERVCTCNIAGSHFNTKSADTVEVEL
jgi:hypothetical protein